MLLRSTTEHENAQTTPLSGGARAVRPWGGLWIRRDHPPRLAPRPRSLHDRCRCASHPSEEGIFTGAPTPLGAV